MRTESIIVVLATVCLANGANILAILGVPSPSHHIWNRALMRALSARGHHITVISSDEEKEHFPNYTQYIMEAGYKDDYDFVSLVNMDRFTAIEQFFKWSTLLCEENLQSKGAQNLMKLANSVQFDLVIVDITAMDCLLGFVHLFNYPPVVGVTAYSHPLWASYITGNPHNPSYVPEFSSGYTDHMTFTERLVNVVTRLHTWYAYEFQCNLETDEIIRKNFGTAVPSIKYLLGNISIVMVNTHTSFDHARPLLPAIVEVGGLHIGPPQPLPQHLKEVMDASSNGFIFFSLGSNLRSDKLTTETRRVLTRAFSKLPYKVLWKWESDSLPDQPSNVVVGKWMPQRDILAHPNIVLFISHCGLLSTQECLYSGVPILCIPFFAEQATNAKKALHHGFGETISFTNMTSNQLLGTIQKITSNTRYRETAQRLSRVFRDQPQTPLERAVFWTEYVIRHKGAPHLRSAGADLPWYQYLLLDVICVLLAGFIITLVLVYKVCRLLGGLVTASTKKQKKQ